MNDWKCTHIGHVLSFAQVPTDADVHLKTPAGSHVEDSDRNDVSDEFFLKLIKNYYGNCYSAANWIQVLLFSLEERDF